MQKKFIYNSNTGLYPDTMYNRLLTKLNLSVDNITLYADFTKLLNQLAYPRYRLEITISNTETKNSFIVVGEGKIVMPYFKCLYGETNIPICAAEFKRCTGITLNIGSVIYFDINRVTTNNPLS